MPCGDRRAKGGKGERGEPSGDRGLKMISLKKALVSMVHACCLVLRYRHQAVQVINRIKHRLPGVVAPHHA